MMMFATQTKWILGAGLALGSMALVAVGLASASAPKPPPQASPVAPKVASTPKTWPEATVIARGVVVDEAGRPRQGVLVRSGAEQPIETRTITAEDGSFTLKVRRYRLNNESLLATADDGKLAGLFSYPNTLTKLQAAEPVKIVLKPTVDVKVRVFDSAEAPVPDAAVQAFGFIASVAADATTGADGTALLRIPADAEIEWIYGLKSGRGFDYISPGEFAQAPFSQGGMKASELPGDVTLHLNTPKTVEIRAVDEDGKPQANVRFQIWNLDKQGARSDINAWSRLLSATTDPEGVATFDWLPDVKRGGITLWPESGEFAHRPYSVNLVNALPVVVELVRNVTIRGRVVHLDGSPAEDILVIANGSGDGIQRNGDLGRARTGEDGSYEMNVAPGEAYAIGVDDADWAAPARMDLVVQAGKLVERVDFTLSKGTLVRGRVALRNGEPVPGVGISLTQIHEEIPKEVASSLEVYLQSLRRHLGATTDSQGRYSIRVGPGTYTLQGPVVSEQSEKPETLVVKGEAEIVHDFLANNPEFCRVSGLVVSKDGNASAGATIEVLVDTPRGNRSFTVRADRLGRFEAERPYGQGRLFALSADGKSAMLAEVGPEITEITISLEPTTQPTGILVDEAGNPAPRRKLTTRLVTNPGGGGRASTPDSLPEIETDDAGRFQLPPLVVGQAYALYVWDGRKSRNLRGFEVKTHDPLDLGTLRLWPRRSAN